MTPRLLRHDIWSLNAIDWDRVVFDALIPLEDGTSYNAYVVKGTEKTVLLDTADPAMAGEFSRQLDPFPSIDCIVSHHAEQDHSGLLPMAAARYPSAKIVCTPKAKQMLADLLPLPEDRFLAVEDNATLDLGGRTLRFLHMPWVHWPETMCTWLEEEKALFSCDFFGSHLATTDLKSTADSKCREAARVYYAQIMMPYARVIRKHLDRVRDLAPTLIAPSHGPAHEPPAWILDAYADWLSEQPKNLVVLPHVSMHGSTAAMVNELIAALAARRIPVQPFDLAHLKLDRLASALVDAATVVVASPSVWNAMHPLAVMAAYLVNGLKPKLKHAAVVGSYGWGTKAFEQFGAMIADLKAEMLPPVLVKGAMKDDTRRQLHDLADQIAARHDALGLV